MAAHTLNILQPNYYYAFREYWDDYTHKRPFTSRTTRPRRCTSTFGMSILTGHTS